MAQWVVDLPCIQEELSSVPSTYVCSFSVHWRPRTREVEQEDSWGSPAS